MQTTVTLPVTLSCMEITFRREMLGWIGATHFLLEPIEGDVPGMFAELRCLDEDVRLRSGAAVPSPRFLMLTPWYVWPSYQVALDDEFCRCPGHQGRGGCDPADDRDPACAARTVNRQSFLPDRGQPSQRFGRSIRTGRE